MSISSSNHKATVPSGDDRFFALTSSLAFLEERLQRRVYFRFLLDHIIQKLLMLQMLVGRHERARPVVLVHFPVSENIRFLQHLLNETDASLVVARQVVAVGEMERIDVVLRRRIAAVDDFKRLHVGGGTDRAAALAAREKLLLGHFLGFGMVRDEHDLDFLVLLAQESAHPEEERPRAIFFEAAHRYGCVVMKECDKSSPTYVEVTERMGGKTMKFTFTEREGDTPIEEWLAEKVKEFALRTYGIEIEISVRSQEVDRDGRRDAWSLPTK